MELSKFVIFSVIVHSILFFSIFDIYFTSPLLNGIQEIHPSIPAPATRLVLFVADGLRADKFYEPDELGAYKNPYLRTVIEDSGSWGVSHTRVPTESRPGHVAMIAGFYEDVSAIAKGWKENPVDFDSVFNQSRTTFAWGSPDILPMFAKGATGNHVKTHCYPAEFESFEGDAYFLDEWVFDKVEEFFESAKTNHTLRARLKQNKIVFFLHLLGIDTNGHTYHPMSNEYLDNIKTVDSGVKRMVEVIEDFYGHDNRTAYIFSADHGMTDWGSHGAGLPSETLTPIVAWGAGISSSSDCLNRLTTEEEYITNMWGLLPSKRCDVNQADIAPLMSTLVGIPIPTNSVGTLPLDYLNFSQKEKAKSMLVNAKQISAQFQAKLEIARQQAIYFKPFPLLKISEVVDLQRKSYDFLLTGEEDKSIETSRKLIDLSLRGLHYYHTYHRRLLYFSVICSYIGWVIVTLITLLRQNKLIVDQTEKHRPLVQSKFSRLGPRLILASALTHSFVLFWLRMKASYYVYCMLPYLIWSYIFKHRFVLCETLSLLFNMPNLLKQVVWCSFLTLLGIWCLVLSFFMRWSLTILLWITAIMFPKRNWVVICILISIFPMLPVVGRSPDHKLIVLGGVIGSLFSIHVFKKKNWLVVLPFVCSLIRPLSTFFEGVPITIHIVSWLLLISSWVLPFSFDIRLKSRLAAVLTCHLSSYILVSLSYDAPFCSLFCYLLFSWIECERDKTTEFKLDFTSSDTEGDAMENKSIIASQFEETVVANVRRSFMFTFLLVLAFFGVGNIASINSFDVKVVLPFITVFNPFIMGGILAYKVLLPNLLVASALYCMGKVTKTSLNQLCYLTLMISDIMGMHFFFLVRDYGSWLDIGTSISHYVIVSSMSLSLLVFIGAAKLLMTYKI